MKALGDFWHAPAALVSVLISSAPNAFPTPGFLFRCGRVEAVAAVEAADG